MPAVTMYWFGGSNYAAPDMHNPDHAEVFNSLAAAREAFASRLDDRRFPCLERDDCEAWIFHGADVVGEEYPDLVLKFGPRGGVITERA